jgi:hypothetical protein
MRTSTLIVRLVFLSFLRNVALGKMVLLGKFLNENRTKMHARTWKSEKYLVWKKDIQVKSMTFSFTCFLFYIPYSEKDAYQLVKVTAYIATQTN